MAVNDRTLKPSKWFSGIGRRLKLNLDMIWRPKSMRFVNVGSTSTVTLTASPTSYTSPNSGSSAAGREEEEEEQQIKELVFRRFDGDGDGKISAYELRSYLGSIGEYISHEEAEQVISALDSDGDYLLDFQDFTRLMKREGSVGGAADHEEDLRKAFEMFEMERGSGWITPKGLQVMLQRCLGDTRTHEECVAMIKFYDVDGNGVLDFSEFQKMMA